jgi:hypothetical protein
MCVGLIFISKGSFMLKMKPFFNKNPRDDSQIKETEFFITEG